MCLGGLPSSARCALSASWAGAGRQHLWNTRGERSQGGRGQWLSSCPPTRGERAARRAVEDEEWEEVPGFGIRRLSWESLETLPWENALGSLKWHVTHPLLPCLWAAPPAPLLGLPHLPLGMGYCCSREGMAKSRRFS